MISTYRTMKAMKQGTKIERYNKGADAIQALKLGKIDAVVIDEQPRLTVCEAEQ